jgi:RNA polymerase sigma-70 factor (ECF subfamily)
MAAGMTARPKLRLVGHDLAPHDPPPRPAPSLDDSQLVAALRDGDPDAATALYVRLRPVVARTVGRLLGYGDRDGEDLGQAAMIELISTIDRYRGDCSLDSWAQTLTAHLVYKHIRRRQTERRLFDGIALDELSVPSREGGAEQQNQGRELLTRIKRHLDHIDEAKAWTFVLHDVLGYDLREVARITESSVAAAQSRLVRGRRELHERIGADPELAARLVAAKGGDA